MGSHGHPALARRPPVAAVVPLLVGVMVVLEVDGEIVVGTPVVVGALVVGTIVGLIVVPVGGALVGVVVAVGVMVGLMVGLGERRVGQSGRPPDACIQIGDEINVEAHIFNVRHHIWPHFAHGRRHLGRLNRPEIHWRYAPPFTTPAHAVLWPKTIQMLNKP